MLSARHHVRSAASNAASQTLSHNPVSLLPLLVAIRALNLLPVSIFSLPSLCPRRCCLSSALAQASLLPLQVVPAHSRDCFFLCIKLRSPHSSACEEPLSSDMVSRLAPCCSCPNPSCCTTLFANENPPTFLLDQLLCAAQLTDRLPLPSRLSRAAGMLSDSLASCRCVSAHCLGSPRCLTGYVSATTPLPSVYLTAWPS